MSEALSSATRPCPVPTRQHFLYLNRKAHRLGLIQPLPCPLQIDTLVNPGCMYLPLTHAQAAKTLTPAMATTNLTLLSTNTLFTSSGVCITP